MVPTSRPAKAEPRLSLSSSSLHRLGRPAPGRRTSCHPCHQAFLQAVPASREAFFRKASLPFSFRSAFLSSSPQSAGRVNPADPAEKQRRLRLATQGELVKPKQGEQNGRRRLDADIDRKTSLARTPAGARESGRRPLISPGRRTRGSLRNSPSRRPHNGSRRSDPRLRGFPTPCGRCGRRGQPRAQTGPFPVSQRPGPRTAYSAAEVPCLTPIDNRRPKRWRHYG
jgi:hypothetical protein